MEAQIVEEAMDMSIPERNVIRKGLSNLFWGIVLMAIDLLLLAISFSIASSIKFGTVQLGALSKANLLPPTYLSVSVFLLVYLFKGLYSFKTYLFWDELRNICMASLLSMLILMVFSFAVKIYYSRFVIVVGTFIFMVIDPIARYVYRRMLFGLGLLKTNVVIVGAGKMGKLLVKKLKEHPFTTYNVIGFLDDDPAKIGSEIEGYKVLGKVEDIDKLARKHRVDEVIVAIPSADRRTLANVISKIECKVGRVKFIPDMYGLITFSTEAQDIDGILAITASQGLLNPTNRMVKRIMDIIVGFIGFLVFLLLYVVVGILIKVEDGGPILFKHTRVGQGLRPFKMYKFRTMVPDAEKKLKELLEKDERLREEWNRYFKLKNDPRITRVGRFLRKTSLDEFPQFINVLKGEMSVVGPRPVVWKEVEQYYGEEVAKKVFSVKPGITGMWQVSGRSDIEDYSERIALDLYYIRNWSIWLDVTILLKTIKVLLERKGAY